MTYTLTALSMGWEYLFTNPITWIYIIFGVFMGLVFGAIPGLTGTLAVVLILPFTFMLAPEDGIATLISIYVGGIAGGLVASILINIPGSPAALVTCFDGSPMARKGRPADALYLGVFSSMVGGTISALFLVLLSSQMANIALRFGSWEYFGLGMFGVLIVVKLCSDNILKGFIGILLGMSLAMAGMDPVLMNERFTYGFWQLGGGFPQIATLMGLFALTEIFTQLNKVAYKEEIEQVPVQKVGFRPSKGLLKGIWKCMFRSSLIGTGIGILPGVGQTTSSLLAYNTEKSSSKNPEKFGTGCKEGIVASEAANNACCGGALIPMLALGVPGDTVTSVLISGLMIHGLTPGPMLFRDEPNIIGAIFIVFIIANFVMFVLELGLMRVFIRVLTSPINYMYPIILVMCALGAYTDKTRVFDCFILLIIGVVGYLLISCGFALTPIILGYILGPIIENNFRVAMIANQGNPLSIGTHPIAIVFIALGVVILLWPQIKKLFRRSRPAGQAA